MTPSRGTFEHLVLHNGHSTDSPIPQTPPASSLQKDEIEAILDYEFVTSSDENFHYLLVQWRGRPILDATWIPMDNVCALAPNLLLDFLFHALPESSPSSSEEYGYAEGLSPGRYGRVYRRHRSRCSDSSTSEVL